MNEIQCAKTNIQCSNSPEDTPVNDLRDQQVKFENLRGKEGHSRCRGDVVPRHRGISLHNVQKDG